MTTTEAICWLAAYLAANGVIYLIWLRRRRAPLQPPTGGIISNHYEFPVHGIIDPDYARIYTVARIVAWQYGFACVPHGSFTRDLDLLIVPWEERAYEKVAEQVIRIVADACGLTSKAGPMKYSDPLDFSAKPHGRRAVSLFLPGVRERRWVDFSVVPCVAPMQAASEELCTPFSHVVLENNNPPWLTAKELRAMLDKCKDHSMVCISGAGPVAKFYSEPGANEPHVLLTTR